MPKQKEHIPSSSNLFPGTLVLLPKHGLFWMGIIVAVYPSTPGHVGCEERVKVLWDMPGNFADLCDCDVMKVDLL